MMGSIIKRLRVLPDGCHQIVLEGDSDEDEHLNVHFVKQPNVMSLTLCRIKSSPDSSESDSSDSDSEDELEDVESTDSREDEEDADDEKDEDDESILPFAYIFGDEYDSELLVPHKDFEVYSEEELQNVTNVLLNERKPFHYYVTEEDRVYTYSPGSVTRSRSLVPSEWWHLRLEKLLNGELNGTTEIRLYLDKGLKRPLVDAPVFERLYKAVRFVKNDRLHNAYGVDKRSGIKYKFHYNEWTGIVYFTEM